MNGIPSLSRETRRFGEQFKASWYFEKWYEKGFLILLTAVLVYTIIRILLQGFW